MDANVLIRPEAPADYAAIAQVNRLAFGGEAEAGLIAALRDSDAFVPEFSLVAVDEERVIGHVLLTPIRIRSGLTATAALALAPVAVTPQRQREGIGSRLIREALAAARRAGHEIVIVLGHAEYYPRFGFVPASRYGVQPPFEVPDEVFMLAWLGKGEPGTIAGVVEYPPAFEGV